MRHSALNYNIITSELFPIIQRSDVLVYRNPPQQLQNDSTFWASCIKRFLGLMILLLPGLGIRYKVRKPTHGKDTTTEGQLHHKIKLATSSELRKIIQKKKHMRQHCKTRKTYETWHKTNLAISELLAEQQPRQTTHRRSKTQGLNTLEQPPNLANYPIGGSKTQAKAAQGHQATKHDNHGL